MPHKCVQCGRDYKDASPVILRGCESCGGRKFLYVGENDRNRDVLLEKSTEALAKEAPDQVLVVSSDPDEKKGSHDRVESIRIIAPGTYELNIEKLANSDERVVGIGTEGNYLLDLHSMIKPGKDKKSRKKS
ncbi:MAG: Zn-ribbon containing protein [Methanomicrobiales archaeon]